MSASIGLTKPLRRVERGAGDKRPVIWGMDEGALQILTRVGELGSWGLLSAMGMPDSALMSSGRLSSTEGCLRSGRLAFADAPSRCPSSSPVHTWAKFAHILSQH